MEEITRARNEKTFESCDEMKLKIKAIPDPRKAIEKRLFEELTEMVTVKIFVA